MDAINLIYSGKLKTSFQEHQSNLGSYVVIFPPVEGFWYKQGIMVLSIILKRGFGQHTSTSWSRFPNMLRCLGSRLRKLTAVRFTVDGDVSYSIFFIMFKHRICKRC